MVGDFNMVEDALDRKGGFGRVVQGKEKNLGLDWSVRFVWKILTFIKLGNLNILGTTKIFTGTILECKIDPSLEIGC